MGLAHTDPCETLPKQARLIGAETVVDTRPPSCPFWTSTHGIARACLRRGISAEVLADYMTNLHPALPHHRSLPDSLCSVSLESQVSEDAAFPCMKPSRRSARRPPRQTRLNFTPLPSSSPAAANLSPDVRNRATAVDYVGSPSPAKRRKIVADNDGARGTLTYLRLCGCKCIGEHTF